ncbi:MAG: LacI family DNA-binding transcriptional regulator [Gemmatimonadaceae bacterium]|nr:LacI family DNA-binding transcriptional regulator [Gemmatimonadaceae bacterium]
MTVSRALSADPKVSALVTEETRERVETMATEMGYTPNLLARSFATGRTGMLGLLTFEIGWEPAGRQTEQILRAADRQDYQMLMAIAAHRLPQTPLEDQALQIDQLIARGVDGLVIRTRGDEGESERIQAAVRERVPVVSYYYPTTNLSGVVLDLERDYLEATQHLIRLGHERIGFMGVWEEKGPVSDKAKGYRQAMDKHGLPYEFLPFLTIDGRGGYLMGKKLGDRFTAIVCRDDYTAIGLCRGLRESGLRVPEDVAVVGSGDLDPGAYVTPALTTLAPPYEEIALSAMDLMLQQLKGDDTPRQVTLRSQLIVRESCGASS